MLFDPENTIVKLCALGMSKEQEGLTEEAAKLFSQAWNEAENDTERFIAAHYLARHQRTVADKLKWDEAALELALKINDDLIRSTFPSLYLNIAKCCEDLNDLPKAKKNYELALSFADKLPDDGYGKLIRGGIVSGLERMKLKIED